MNNHKFIATVSQVNRRIALNIKRDAELADICIAGEVSNFIHHYKSGHIYYTLKDADSSLKCVMFAQEARSLSFQPENGQNVVARGRIQVYEPGGVYQLYTTALELPEAEKQEESLYEAFLKLKEKLEKDGVFTNARPLPAYPERIALITAKDSAALADMLSVFERRYPVLELVLIPALVQGKGAPASLISALEAAGSADADLIIIARGGGSAEDLWAFNDEALAREIYASAVPVVSGVGHETDFTIADFAADFRAATPTAAAELATPDLSDLPDVLDSLLADMRRRVNNKLTYKIKEIEAAERLINALNPEKVFRRGYAAVFGADGKAVKTSAGVEAGDELRIRLAEGELTVTVKEKR
jgi:exodeoxyribonuclease VII large subunit